MTWAIYTTPEDKDEIMSAFTEAGLTGGEWNRIKDYALAFVQGWDANIPVPPEHPCYATDAATMRVIVMNVGTKADWLAEVQRLLNRANKDRRILQPYFDLINATQWYAVDPYPPAPGFFDGMTCT